MTNIDEKERAERDMRHTISAVKKDDSDEQIGGDSEALARWLRDVARGHRPAPLRSETASYQRPRESSDDLIKYLEALMGRRFTSREDINDFLKQIQAEEDEKTRAATRRRVRRETLLLGCLLASYLHYHYWDVSLQVASLQKVQVFVPVKDLKSTSTRT